MAALEDREDLPDTEVRGDTVLTSQGNHNKEASGRTSPMVQILYYFLHEVCLLKPNYPTSWPQGNNRNHRHLFFTSPCFPCQSWANSAASQLLGLGPGNSEPFVSDVCRAGGKCWELQASVRPFLLLLASQLGYAQAPPQCLASVRSAPAGVFASTQQ